MCRVGPDGIGRTFASHQGGDNSKSTRSTNRNAADGDGDTRWVREPQMSYGSEGMGACTEHRLRRDARKRASRSRTEAAGRAVRGEARRDEEQDDATSPPEASSHRLDLVVGGPRKAPSPSRVFYVTSTGGLAPTRSMPPPGQAWMGNATAGGLGGTRRASCPTSREFLSDDARLSFWDGNVAAQPSLARTDHDENHNGCTGGQDPCSLSTVRRTGVLRRGHPYRQPARYRNSSQAIGVHHGAHAWQESNMVGSLLGGGQT
jgi:hypothetical protein